MKSEKVTISDYLTSELGSYLQYLW